MQTKGFACKLQPCPSFPWLFCLTKENLQIYQGFSIPAERMKTLENKRRAPFYRAHTKGVMQPHAS